MPPRGTAIAAPGVYCGPAVTLRSQVAVLRLLREWSTSPASTTPSRRVDTFAGSSHWLATSVTGTHRYPTYSPDVTFDTSGRCLSVIESCFVFTTVRVFARSVLCSTW